MRTQTLKHRESGNKNINGDPFRHFYITVPSKLAKRIPPWVEFKAELTDEGLLFRVIDPKHQKDDPEWALSE